MNDKPTAFLAIDVEKAGHLLLRDRLVSVGWCLGTQDGQIVDKGRINVLVRWPVWNDVFEEWNHGDFDRRCWHDFWDNPAKISPEAREDCKKNAVESEDGAQQFLAKLAEWEGKYELKIISDNPSFDVPAVDIWLETRGKWNRTLHYGPDMSYRCVFDVGDLWDLLPIETMQRHKAYFDSVTHDHRPENDAHSHLLKYYVAEEQHTKVPCAWCNAKSKAPNLGLNLSIGSQY